MLVTVKIFNVEEIKQPLFESDREVIQHVGEKMLFLCIAFCQVV